VIPITRRQLLSGAFGLAAGATLAACGSSSLGTAGGLGPIPATPTTGQTRSFALRARRTEVDLGGKVVSTWAYGDTVPGKPLRANVGDRVKVAFANDLPEPTSVHWHGLAIRNDMDGVPMVTTPEVAAGSNFDFDFVVPDAGTHWFHPHTGLQIDHGLYAPFIVDDPAEPGAYDHEWIIVLDDWTDGVGDTPEQLLAKLQSDAGGQASGDAGRSGMGMGGMQMGGGGGSGASEMSGMSGMDGGDVTYPLYLINGRSSTDPEVFTAKPGQKVRLRIINAGADTIFTLALGGHELRVTHTDGFPVEPVTTTALTIAMGERYDAMVTFKDGVFPLVAEPVSKTGSARALIRTGSGAVPAMANRPSELDAYPLAVSALSVANGHALASRQPDSVQDLVLTGSMRPYEWKINGRTYADTVPLTIRAGQAGRLNIRNHSMMPHPIHLHGHTFQLGPAGGSGPRKDTVLIPAMGRTSVDFAATNPGKWMVHCHNAYHAEAGMMTRLEYAD